MYRRESKQPLDESQYISKGPCENCGSSDACALYTDGHRYCFSCGYTFPTEGTKDHMTYQNPYQDVSGILQRGNIKRIASRNISEDTCKLFGYHIVKHNGRTAQVADYRDTHGKRVVFQKLRFEDKTFSTKGNIEAAGLFGQHLWGDGNDKLKVVITEGEIDCMSVSEVQSNKYPVVSIPNGTKGAVKAITKALPWLSTFGEIILFFDNDEQGQQAAEDAAKVLPPGKAYITHLDTYKDASEALQAKDRNAIFNAIHRTRKLYRPSEIIDIREMLGCLTHEVEAGVPLPWEDVSAATFGVRMHEIWLLASGSGMGKTEMFKEFLHHFSTALSTPCGAVLLEENAEHTVRCIVGKALNKRLHIPGQQVTDEELEKVSTLYDAGRVYIDKHDGNSNFDDILNKIRYMVNGLGCRFIFLDHITAMAEGKGEGDKNGYIHYMMEEINKFVQANDCTLFLISHIRKTQKKAAEEGGRISVDDLYGSGAMKQRSNFIFLLEGDEDDPKRRILRCAKDRYTGQAKDLEWGFTYDADTGRYLREDFSGSSEFPSEKEEQQQYEQEDF